MVGEFSLQDEIRRLKKERNAVILAHNYQVGEIQDVADYIGDSLGLSRKAAKTDADVILFCGVHFMAETASMICPDKTVLVPDLKAGCSLADMIDVESLRRWKEEHPGAVVVSYINTTADVKAESDYVCTSTNALKVINAIPPDREILFLPDKYLGTYLQSQTKRVIHIWPGYCPAHVRIRPDNIIQLRQEHPEAEFLMHPECGCMTACMGVADKIISTEGMVNYVTESPRKEFIIATEVGILHRMQQLNPEKSFYAANETAACSHMKVNTLEKVLWSLEDMAYEVKVPEETASRARLAIERMLQIA